ncbi:hypothetical protein Hanom_Chr03g00274591 [Helianthus anomalus]
MLFDQEQGVAERDATKKDLQAAQVEKAELIANSILNSAELDESVARVMIAARSDGYTQGYYECAHHVVNELKVKWDTSRSATHGIDTDTAYIKAKRAYERLKLPVMEQVNEALHHEDFVNRLKTILPDEDDAE